MDGTVGFQPDFGLRPAGTGIVRRLALATEFEAASILDFEKGESHLLILGEADRVVSVGCSSEIQVTSSSALPPRLRHSSTRRGSSCPDCPSRARIRSCICTSQQLIQEPTPHSNTSALA